MYRHLDNLELPIDLPVGKVVCVGRNYLDHVKEMNAQVSEQAMFFMKPVTALTPMYNPVKIPADKGECHNEIEIAVLIKDRLCNADEDAAEAAIWGVGLGLDLTLRDVQANLKKQGHPWERAKAFDASCPVSGFIPASQIPDFQDIRFSLRVNDENRQLGHTKDMMRGICSLVAEISESFTLESGDIVLTGTPSGVAALAHGDNIEAALDGHFLIQTNVVAV
ncbi:fumarylacetoacetate hydrolase family protein [Salinimonas iocasae]|uniref:Fumarylacetoacetate hydrolase family protein n=1 Tax=Salinimonas iocasae TaxID=2572577 RepID=A0A5B7YCY0_9ALTE|nr:fumarylacetoacetate hydrolase family protein [Salinimonas iocasae]QCZ93123.1 fumarylacetoacetate hydrolase family protein [Salinimonas iocasae]